MTISAQRTGRTDGSVTVRPASPSRAGRTRSTAPAIRPRTVGVVGLGYVGLPTALALADAGVVVAGYDISEARLAAIGEGAVDLLDVDRKRLERVFGSDTLTLSQDGSVLADVETILICVPTPVDAHLVPDLSALSACCAAVVATARPGQTIVLTSTTYVGCTRELLAEPLERRGFTIGSDIFVAFSPERIDPGVSAHVPESTPRVVGGVTSECTARAVRVLADVSAAVHPLSSPETAELTKLLENTFRAVNIALANEFAGIAREFRVDVMEVIEAAATKPYGYMPFYPGPGVGGHCIPCDPHYLLWQLKANRRQSPVTEAAMTSIAARPHSVVDRAQEVLGRSGIPLAGARVLVVGVAYKPGVADVRESPALEILDELGRRDARVAFTDAMVDHVHTASGLLFGETDPESGDWDLVIAHTLHPGVDHSWISTASVVLDATYKLEEVAHRDIL
ncbi:nucleotide sugar dehydrogenase [Rhodococcus rhodochrous]|uniref:nucleotide sugar dehydrogenase n=1 Tax=Rhodococcus rhodochrous TaxID=1829 RepID=UPI0002E77342|nr:nucleotide sugar dehydrogenase [Rhodococcus rhodochrous]